MRFLTRVKDADDVSAFVRRERGARGNLLDLERADHVASSPAADERSTTAPPVASKTEEPSVSAAASKPRATGLSRSGAKVKKTRGGGDTRKVSKWRRRRRKAQRDRENKRTRDDEPQVAATAT